MNSSVSPQSNGLVMPFRPRTILGPVPCSFVFYANLTIAPVGNAGRPIVTQMLNGTGDIDSGTRKPEQRPITAWSQDEKQHHRSHTDQPEEVRRPHDEGPD